MATLYLVEQGATLKKEGKRFVVEKVGKIIFEIPAFKIERVLIFGNIQITTQAISFLLSNEEFHQFSGSKLTFIVPQSS